MIVQCCLYIILLDREVEASIVLLVLLEVNDVSLSLKYVVFREAYLPEWQELIEAEGVVADKDADIVLLSILVMFKSPLLNFAVTKYLSNNFVKSVM